MRRCLGIIAMWCVVVVVAPTLLPAGDHKEPKAATDKKRLQGTWKVISLERDGKRVKGVIGKTLIFDRDKLIPQGFEESKITLQLNPQETPKEFDVLVDGTVTVRGIYELHGDLLTACYGDGNHVLKRPKEFSGAEGRNQNLLSAKKVKDKENESNKKTGH